MTTLKVSAILIAIPPLLSYAMSTQGSEYVATGATSGLSNLTLQGPPSLPMWATSPLNPALASFSIETAFFEEYMGNSSSPNTLSQALFENLSNRTGVPAEVRIGGITADSAFWDGNLNQALYNFIDSSGALINTTLGPAFWEVVELLPNETNIVFTLGLESLNYTGALYMAEAMWAGLRDSSVNISRFEIGNEPDQYSIHLNAQNYTEYWEPWSGNISKDLGVNYPEFQIGATAIDPLWPYNTSAADAQFDCVSALAAGADDGHTAKTCSEHTYQYSVCDPTRAAIATLPNLVNHTRLAMYLDLWQPRIHSVREQLGPDSFVIGEFNSVSCSGRDNVSNTFGQAMWLLDTTLYAASINVSRVYVHQGGPLALQSSTQLNHGGLSLYNLWYPIENQNGPIQVFPAYSAYLFVAEAIGHSTSLQIANIFPGRQANGSSITTADGDPSAGQVVVYGFWDETSSYGLNYPSKLALLNMQIYNQTDTGARPNVTFDILAYLPDANQVITAKRLTAPGADVKAANVTTWAGQNFASGYGEGQYVDETLSGGKIDVEASSAVLVFW